VWGEFRLDLRAVGVDLVGKIAGFWNDFGLINFKNKLPEQAGENPPGGLLAAHRSTS